MTERDVFELSEKKQAIINAQGGRCYNCGGPVNQYTSPQLAHRIAQTKSNLKKYGREIIHHPLNTPAVCCLACNDAVNIGFNPGETEKLVSEILETCV
jgi:hypothetical protein